MTIPADTPASTPLTRALAAVTQTLCLHRDTLPVFAPGKLYLRCQRCGWESDGWDTTKPQPQPQPIAEAEEEGTTHVATTSLA